MKQPRSVNTTYRNIGGKPNNCIRTISATDKDEHLNRGFAVQTNSRTAANMGEKQKSRKLRRQRPSFDSRNDPHYNQQHDEGGNSLNESSSTHRALQMLNQDQNGSNQFVCESLTVVDACRGTSVGYKYRGTFYPYDGPCDKGNKILNDYPIYRTNPSGPNDAPKYMYAIDVYPQNWSAKDLAGLVRWRIVDFENFQDETSCRVESANINQIDFAADGQPYNYWPTIYCFDENGNDMDGYKSSTINIRCNDRSNNNSNNNNDDGNSEVGGPGQQKSNTSLFLGIMLALAALAFGGYILYNRCFKNKNKVEDSAKAPTTKGTTTISSNDDEDDKLLNKIMIFPSNIDEESHRSDPEPRTGNFDDLESPRKPFSTNSIMVDDVSVFTVNKPYELVERKIQKEKRAPEPPKASPVSSPESSQRDFIPNKFAVVPTKSRSKSSTRRADQSWIKRPNDDNDGQNDDEPKPVQHHQYKPMQRPPPHQQESPKMHLQNPSLPKSASEKSSSFSEKHFSEESTFMSESLSNMFKDIDKSLDDALSLEEDDQQNRNRASPEVQDREPPGTPAGAIPRKSVAPLFPSNNNPNKLGKNDEMDLSQRSKFMQARGKWSDRGRGFGKEEYQRSRSYDDSKASKHASSKTSRTPIHERFGETSMGGKVSELLFKFNNNVQQPRRSKSLDNSRAKEFATNRRTAPAPVPPRRSRSKERTGASTFAQQKTNNPRSRSKERTGANTFTQQKTGNSNPRSRSKERSGANAFPQQQKTGIPRSRSKERSRANTHADTNRRSRSNERSGANDFFTKQRKPTRATPQTGRSRSRERTGANTFATKRSSSQERSASNTYAAQQDARRGRSKERSGASAYATKTARPRSLEQTGARGYAQQTTSGKARPSRSLERTSADKYAGNKRQPAATRGSAVPKTRSRSFDASGAKNFASKGKAIKGTTPKRRSTSYDSSKAKQYAGHKPVPPRPSTVITKKKDGSVLVERRRKREDGATVITKTKYATIALARKHGVKL